MNCKTNLKSNNKTFGNEGERAACLYLTKQGYEVVAKNYNYKNLGEIDVIAQKDDYIVFVEVKRRSSNLYGGPLYAISEKKKRILRKIANYYILTNKLNNSNYTYRFDLIAISGEEIEWVQDIIR
jgi:putative endonuclease